MLILGKVALVVALAALFITALRVATADVHMGRARITADGNVVIGDATVRLTGIRMLNHDVWCLRKAERWPCGAMSASALSRLVDDRWLFCREVGGATPVLATCHAALDDIARTLVRQGWAIADRNQYAAEQAEAMIAGRGLWMPGAPVAESRSMAATCP